MKALFFDWFQKPGCKNIAEGGQGGGHKKYYVYTLELSHARR